MRKFPKLDFDPFSFILLVCGIIMLLVGIYQYLTNLPATGISMPGRSGTGGGDPVIVSGKFMICMGAAFFVGGIVMALPPSSNDKNKKTKRKS